MQSNEKETEIIGQNPKPPFTQTKKIELDEYGEKALLLLTDSYQSFFLTGNGGTGKTFLINHFLEGNRALPEKKQKKVQMLATTGAAAQLYEFGETYHSFFRIFGERLGSIDRDQKAVMKHYDTFIIDEASMISASQFDLIDKRLKQVTGNHEQLFGGKQIIFVGHLFQASPVVTQETKDQYFEINNQKYDDVYKSIFFFDALNFDPEYFKIIELKKTHRTTDITLQTYLKNLMLGENLTAVCKYFNENFKKEDEINYDKAIYIANTNSKVDKYNALMLDQLIDGGAELVVNLAKHWNWDVDNYGRICKEPAPLEVKFCIGARIIFNKNSDSYKNGTMGKIIDYKWVHDLVNDIDVPLVVVQLDTGILLDITQVVWNKYESCVVGQDEDGQDIIDHQIIGSFTQFPFQLGWGITAHKSQGKTFDNIIVDMGLVSYKEGAEWKKKAVEHIIYVALSRATNYAGIQVVQWLKPEAIAVNEDVKKITQTLIK